jgi:Family of unknown function (DUF6504)
MVPGRRTDARPDRWEAQAGEYVSGVRSEPVEVWLIDGRPARFVWRERLYTVLSILERPSPEPEPHPPDGHEGERDHNDAPVAWRCWKVAASAGRNIPANVYRLCHDAAADRWQLTRDGR